MDLPVVDLAPFLQAAAGDAAAAPAEALRALCATVSASLRDTGALLVKDPRCTAADNDRFLDVVERYFARSDDSKRLQERPHLHYQVGVTPEGVEVPRSLVDKEMQDRIKSMPEEFQPATPKGPDPKWRYMWRVGPRPSNTRFKELNAEPVIPDGLPEWKETMDSWGAKMISAIEVVAEMAAIGFGLSRSLPAPPNRRRPPPPPPQQSPPPPPSRSVLPRGRPRARLLDSRAHLPREIRHRRLGAAAPLSGGDPPLGPPPSRLPAYNILPDLCSVLAASQLGWLCGICFITALAYIFHWTETKGRLELAI